MNKKLLICLFMWVMCLPAFAQETLTVFDGTTGDTGTSTSIVTNDYLPAFIRYWNKAGTKSQFIIPASYLAEMKGGDISSVKFYSTSYNTPYTSASTADVYVSEVDYTAYDSQHFDFEPKANCTIVYQGTVTVERVGPTNQEWGEMTITFNAPYKYCGGNLLIGFENTTTDGWKAFKFRGQNVMWHAGLAGEQETTYYYKQQCDFIPWTTFTYTPGEPEPAFEEFYLVGTFNEWNTTEEGGRLVFAATEEDGIYEAESPLEANAEFKVITPNAEGDGWIWLGGNDEWGGGYFMINSDLYNQPIAMVDGANFRIDQAGEFTFIVNANDMTLTVIPKENPVLHGDVNGDGDVTSADVTALFNFILLGDDSDIVNGDQTGDGEITSADITEVYNVLLGV